MPVLDGVAATRRLAAAVPDTAVLVLTMFEDDEAVFAAMRAGARGYLLKGAEQEQILAAIRSVVAGQVVIGPGRGHPAAQPPGRPAPARARLPRADPAGAGDPRPDRPGPQQHHDRRPAAAGPQDGGQPHLRDLRQAAGGDPRRGRGAGPGRWPRPGPGRRARARPAGSPNDRPGARPVGMVAARWVDAGRRRARRGRAGVAVGGPAGRRSRPSGRWSSAPATRWSARWRCAGPTCRAAGCSWHRGDPAGRAAAAGPRPTAARAGRWSGWPSGC